MRGCGVGRLIDRTPGGFMHTMAHAR
jgi:hypothetical protein